MKIENIDWIGKPKFSDSGFYSYTLWPYKIKNCDTTFWMDETEYNLIMIEKKILQSIETLIIADSENMNTKKEGILKLIDEYAEENRSAEYKRAKENFYE